MGNSSRIRKVCSRKGQDWVLRIVDNGRFAILEKIRCRAHSIRQLTNHQTIWWPKWTNIIARVTPILPQIRQHRSLRNWIRKVIGRKLVQIIVNSINCFISYLEEQRLLFRMLFKVQISKTNKYIKQLKRKIVESRQTLTKSMRHLIWRRVRWYLPIIRWIIS